MKFKNPFSFRSRPKPSMISILSNTDEWDHPDSVHLASIVVGDYGAVLNQTSIFVFGVSEKRLPYPKKEIEAAIELLLKFLNNKESWGKLKHEHPQMAAEIMTDRYYNALKVGYVELAKFLPYDEAEPCERASRLLQKQHNLETVDGLIDEFKLPWFEEVLHIKKRISENSSLRLKWLQNNFGTENILF
jgi:hypothetical protein